MIAKDLMGKHLVHVSENLNQTGCVLIMLKQYEKAIDLFYKAIVC